MATAPLHVVGIGNAIVDVLSAVEDSVLDQQGLVKGSMRLCHEAEAAAIYAAMGPAREVSGGSAANTAAGVASFGGRAAFVGKVGDDQFGAVFGHDIRAAGVHFADALTVGGPTGRCLVLISPDAQRTMSTFLGVGGLLEPGDVPADVIEAADVTFLEGYLWEEPSAKQAILAAIEVAHGAGNRVAFSLSDSFCVERNRADFVDLLGRSVDIVFANEAEVCSLFEVDDFDTAVDRVRRLVPLSAVTRGARGSVVVTDDQFEEVAAASVDEVVDTTGAGDLYAAGVLFGLTNGYDLAGAGRLGSLAASEVISHVGARPEISLATLV